MPTTLEGQRIARQESIRDPSAAARSDEAPAARADRVDRVDRAREGEYLTFHVGPEEYGIDILRVQEIRSYEQPTRIANSPAFIKGVVNLRGVIVPIVDLRLKLGCDRVEYNGFTVVIVLNVKGRVVGVVVDSVSDVLELGKGHIKPAPELSSGVESGFITGIGTVASGDTERMLILLDMVALMASAEMGLVAA